jgi:hypothetical protein
MCYLTVNSDNTDTCQRGDNADRAYISGDKTDTILVTRTVVALTQLLQLLQ